MTESFNPTVSVIIPTYNAANEIAELLDNLIIQRYPVHEILVVDSESTDETVSICKKYDNVRIIGIKKADFDHGRTRDMAFRNSSGSVVVFLTQDCIPANASFLEEIIAPLKDGKVALCSGRQLPKSNATEMERLVRSFNYPAESHIRSKEDLSVMGIKTFFCSDVCSAYNRKIYLQLGGFDYPLKTNEDMFFAAKAINSGYKIAYNANAQVYHSHNFSLKQQYNRNYIQGYEIERHKDILCGVSQNKEGMRLVRYVSRELLKKGHFVLFVRFVFDCFARFLGSKNGKRRARHSL